MGLGQVKSAQGSGLSHGFPASGRSGPAPRRKAPRSGRDAWGVQEWWGVSGPAGWGFPKRDLSSSAQEPGCRVG